MIWACRKELLALLSCQKEVEERDVTNLLLGPFQGLRVAGREADAGHRVHAAAHALQRRNRHVADALANDLADRLEECVAEVTGAVRGGRTEEFVSTFCALSFFMLGRGW